jgi:hypothetical protein
MLNLPAIILLQEKLIYDKEMYLVLLYRFIVS